MRERHPAGLVTATIDERRGLRDLGYVEGQNITIEYRLAAGDFSRLHAMAGELVRGGTL